MDMEKKAMENDILPLWQFYGTEDHYVKQNKPHLEWHVLHAYIYIREHKNIHFKVIETKMEATKRKRNRWKSCLLISKFELNKNKKFWCAIAKGMVRIDDNFVENFQIYLEKPNERMLFSPYNMVEA